MTTVTEKKGKKGTDAPPGRHTMSPNWEKALDKVLQEHDEALRRLAKL